MAKRKQISIHINNLVAKNAPLSGSGPHSDRKQQTRQIRQQKHRKDLAGDDFRHDHHLMISLLQAAGT